jgi:putative iron-regulated protein
VLLTAGEKSVLVLVPTLALRIPHFAIRGLLLLIALLLIACSAKPSEPEQRAVLHAYQQLAFAVYDDAYRDSELLYQSFVQLQQEPSTETLAVARSAWRAARVSYSQSEALRFGHWFVDEWESRVNSWPVDEGFIDYVDDSYQASPSNPWARMNIIGSESISVAGRNIPVSYIVNRQLEMLEVESDVESIVATGYHALEFMLWGQDTHQLTAGAGQRPWTDFVVKEGICSNGNALASSEAPCRKRNEFLQTVSLKLMADLHVMRGHWALQTGSAGSRLAAGDIQVGMSRVLFGLLAMTIEELAGERLHVALMSHAAEEEQDCFSDDTHHSLWYNALGIENFYYGRYKGRSELHAESTSLAALAQKYSSQLAVDLDSAFAETKAAMEAIVESAERDAQYFDQLIVPGNAVGQQKLQRAISALQEQSALLSKLAETFGWPLTHTAISGKGAL